MLTRELDADLLVMSTHGRSGVSRFMLGSNASATIHLATRPVLLLRPQALAAGETPQVTRVLAPLDGSGFAEQVLPWVHAFANVSNAEMILLAVPEVPEPALYGGCVRPWRNSASGQRRIPAVTSMGWRSNCKSWASTHVQC